MKTGRIKTDNYGFAKVYFVISRPSFEVYVIESIAFKTREQVQAQCDYKNKTQSTTMYSVFETIMHI